MRRTTFLVDGFNLYHSLLEASRALGGEGTRWLDLRALCSSLLAEVRGGARLDRVVYFTALATHRTSLDPGVVQRHRAYMDCLRATGVEISLGHFKAKRRRCPQCHQPLLQHEEKETDVAIGATLLELLWQGRCDSIVLVTGDSDLGPAVRVARRNHPDKPIYCAFPFRRLSFELRALAVRSFRIGAVRYVQHQFPDPFVLPSGRAMHRPPGW